MRNSAIITLLCAIAVPAVSAAEINVTVGVPAISVPAPPRVVIPAPPGIVFETPPLFLSPSGAGYYVGVDTPYDIVFISGTYYLFQGERWYSANHHNGPWLFVRHDRLPAALRKHSIERIRHYREQEYRYYQRDREHYRGQYYRPVYEQREEYRREKEERHHYSR